MTLHRFIIGMAIALAPAGGDSAKQTYPRPELLIEAPALAAKLNDFRILDVRPKAKYDQGHVPGAVRVDPVAWAKAFAAGQEICMQEAWAVTGELPAASSCVYAGRSRDRVGTHVTAVTAPSSQPQFDYVFGTEAAPAVGPRISVTLATGPGTPPGSRARPARRSAEPGGHNCAPACPAR